MMRSPNRSPWLMLSLALPSVAAVAGLAVAFTGATPDSGDAPVDQAQVLRGRELVMEHVCSGCHGGADPSSDGWLAGAVDGAPPEFMDFHIGPFHTYARNLTPDNTTGLGRFSERQIFNALRYGLRPGDTPDVEITSTTPGQGNFPEHPSYLAPPMPWPSWRYMPDEDLWAIAAYLKHGVKPVHHRVPDSEGPPDFWAGLYVADTIGTYPARAFPTANEKEPPAGVNRSKVLQGRALVLEHACGDCHGGITNPSAPNWLHGITSPSQEMLLGDCGADAAGPCFHNRPRNLTPDNATGVGQYSERQIFNALRYGLSPRHTPDVEITSSTPGQGGFPVHPTYLAPWMPWPWFRHMSDEDLWAIAAYLKYGLKPVSNHVADSDAPPDAWVGTYATPGMLGAYPTPTFPTKNEIGG